MWEVISESTGRKVGSEIVKEKKPVERVLLSSILLCATGAHSEKQWEKCRTCFIFYQRDKGAEEFIHHLLSAIGGCVWMLATYTQGVSYLDTGVQERP